MNAVHIEVCIAFFLKTRLKLKTEAAFKPLRVFLQNTLKEAAIPDKFAGIAKDSPQSVSLFIPTNVGIHGTSDRIRTGVSALRGPRPRPLDNGGKMAGEQGFEP